MRTQDIVLVDKEKAISLLPMRRADANKGAFGKTLIIAGSKQYMGAGLLALESALRGGAGYTAYLNENEMCDLALTKYPEAIYYRLPLSELEAIEEASRGFSSILIGPGLGTSREVAALAEALITTKGGVLVIDADGLNSISKFLGKEIFRKRKREIVITPHPLEFSRLIGDTDAEEVNADRVKLATLFAKDYGITVLLKGMGTIITDGDRIYKNASGSVALAKAGSGDVLSGLLASLCAFMADKTDAAALSAFIHGFAADRLKGELSSFGVIPSDLPKEMARSISELEKAREI